MEMKKATQMSRLQVLPRTGFEPARCYSLPPQSSASANSATWALGSELYARVLTCREWNDAVAGDQEQAPPGLRVYLVAPGEGAEGGEDCAAVVEDEAGDGGDRAVVIGEVNRRMDVA